MDHTVAMVVNLQDLRRVREAVVDVAAYRGARDVRVFGSVARGESTAASDVDLLVEFESGRSLLDQVHLIADLEELLGTRVDVVAEGGLLERDAHILVAALPL